MPGNLLKSSIQSSCYLITGEILLQGQHNGVWAWRHHLVQYLYTAHDGMNRSICPLCNCTCFTYIGESSVSTSASAFSNASHEICRKSKCQHWSLPNSSWLAKAKAIHVDQASSICVVGNLLTCTKTAQNLQPNNIQCHIICWGILLNTKLIPNASEKSHTPITQLLSFQAPITSIASAPPSSPPPDFPTIPALPPPPHSSAPPAQTPPHP